MHEIEANPAVGPDPGREQAQTGQYNPGELRLYGRRGRLTKSVTAADVEMLVDKLKDLATEQNEDKVGIVRKMIDRVRPEPAAEDEIITFRVTSAREGARQEFVEYSLAIADPETARDVSSRSVGVIYGYAYEGHCYKLPKPQIMILPCEPNDLTSDECGFSRNLGYSVWEIDKLKRVMMLDLRSDSLKTLIIDENTPGRRSPIAYAQAMALAPPRQRGE